MATFEPVLIGYAFIAAKTGRESLSQRTTDRRLSAGQFGLTGAFKCGAERTK
jgi:hypothetical protein